MARLIILIIEAGALAGLFATGVARAVQEHLILSVKDKDIYFKQNDCLSSQRAVSRLKKTLQLFYLRSQSGIFVRGLVTGA